MREPLRFFLLFYGLLETFIFTGNILGWSALHHMLRQEGVYSQLCDEPQYNVTSGTSEEEDKILATTEVQNVVRINGQKRSKYKTCETQDTMLNLAYTIGSFCIGITAFAWGFILDRYGLRFVRLFINVLLMTGTVLLSLTKKQTSYLLFPALVLMCLAGVPLRLANMQIANLFPNQRSTIITLYSGAFAASASVFVFIKYFFDAGLSWEWSCFLLIFFSILMLPITMFLLPSRRVLEPDPLEKPSLSFGFNGSKKLSDSQPTLFGTYSVIEESYGSIVRGNGASDCNGSSSTGNSQKTLYEKSNSHKEECRSIPLKNSLFSWSYAMHQYWFCWLILFTIVFVGTLHLWCERTFKEPKRSAFFVQLYGLCQVAGLFLGPLSGMFMDLNISRASKEKDLDVRRLQVLQSNFWPITITTLMAVVAQATKFIDSAAAIWVSIIFVTICRTFLLSIGTVYLRIRFPAEHFNRLLGIMSTMSAIFTLLQFPLFIWENSSLKSVIQVNIFDSACLLLACLHPLLLLITPLQKYFIRREKEDKEKLQRPRT